MSIAARVASLHPLIICGVWLLPFATMATPAFTPLISSWLLIWLVWMPCVYVVARNATTPPPQKRYPLFAITMFTLAIIGQIIGLVMQALEPLDDGAWPSPIHLAGAASFVIGVFASIWVTADALIKAETGRTYLADPPSVWDTHALLMLAGVGIWFLHPRIKRLLAANAA